MDNDNVPLPILDGKNYAKWRLRIQCILEAKELDTVVYNEPQGTSTSDAEKLAIMTSEYKVKCARAKMILINAVDDKHTVIIMPCKSASEIWSRLEQEYADKEPVNVQALLVEYYAATMDSKKSVSEYIAYIDNLVERLPEGGQKIPQIGVMAKITSSLPPEYSNFRRTWEMLPEC